MGGWESAWIAIGSLAIAGVFATAWIRPRIAGWDQTRVTLGIGL
jgi:hypothetical protein